MMYRHQEEEEEEEELGTSELYAPILLLDLIKGRYRVFLNNLTLPYVATVCNKTDAKVNMTTELIIFKVKFDGDFSIHLIKLVLPRN